MKAEDAGYAGVLILKKRRRMLLASLPPRSSIGQKRFAGLKKVNREDYGVDKYLGIFCF
jgi:hypothetical protein